MAKLKAHGERLDLLQYAGFRLALMSDGKILRNCGDGWKLYKFVKAGNDIREHMAKKRRTYNEKMVECPSYAAFIRGLCDLFPFKHHYTVRLAIEMMPDDPDGVWSSLEDYGLHADIDDLVTLCRNYVAGQKEMAAYRERRKK